VIRPAEARDEAAVIALWTHAYVTEGEGGRTELYGQADFHDTARRGRMLIAEREGEVSGVVALLAPGAPERAVAREEEAELSRLAVAPTARRLGIGRDLARACEQIARERGWPAIALWSRPYQTAAHHLYESLGYERIPERDETDSSGHARLVFRLVLTR
jgi:ribosomal protein S18 acetylase RimI-like enzyme